MASENAPLLGDSKDSISSDSDSDKKVWQQYSHANSSEINIVSTYDDVLPHVGNIGVWQVVTVVLLGVLAADGGILVLLQNFTALEPKAFRCALSACDGPSAEYNDLQLIPTNDCPATEISFKDTPNSGDGVCWKSIDDIKNKSYSIEIEKVKMCVKPTIISLNHIKNETNFISNCSILSSHLITGTEFCDVSDPDQKILYEPYEYTSTIVTEFSLVCEEQYKIALSGTFYMVGLLVGSFVGGPPADKFGRKPVLFFFLICAGDNYKRAK